MRFALERVKGWVSVAASDGSLLLETITDEEYISELYSKAGVTQSESSSPGGSRRTRYRCVKRSVVRSDFDTNSDKMGNLDVGTEVTVTDTHKNKKGQLRVKFEAATISGWTSTTAGDGSILLEKIEELDDDNEDTHRDGPYDDDQVAPEPEPDELTGIEKYLDNFLAQKLHARYGCLQVEFEDGNEMSVDAVMFACADLQVVESMQGLREELLAEARGESDQVATSADGSVSIQFDVKMDKEQSNEDEFVFKVTSILDANSKLQSSWVIKKRFADFLKLDDKLRKSFESKDLFSLPRAGAKQKLSAMKKMTKKAKKKISTEIDRAAACESYLIMASMHKDVVKNPDLSMFLNSGISEFIGPSGESERNLDAAKHVSDLAGISQHSTEEQCIEFIKAHQEQSK
ncbi:PX domain-containing protein [bacterium]|nr:PX domain-containing protein [bacterium]